MPGLVYVNAFSSPPRQLINLPYHLPTISSHKLLTPALNSTASVTATATATVRFNRTAVAASAPAGVGPIMWPQNGVVSDICATGVALAVAFGFLTLWQQTAKHGIFDQKLNRKLVHISIGLVFMLCWPLFSSGYRGAVFASLIPGVNILRMLVIGLGVYKDEATVKSMSRFGDYRELLKGPLYYASTITFACVYYWRTSAIGIGAICNLCAGDGMADIVGRRLGKRKLPYNKNKSFAGSIAMAAAGLLTSVGYMYYFSRFGFIQMSWNLVFGCFCMSIASAVVESLPISTDIDDNLTVSLTSFLVGTLFF